MKPLGRALEAAKFTHTNQQQALDQLLSGYCSTQHPGMFTAPWDVLLCGRYKTDFPHHVLTDQQVQVAQIKDIAQKDTWTTTIKSSLHCQGFQVRIGDKVLLKNNKRDSQFDPIYEPTPYTVNSLDEKGVYVTHPDGTIHHRHKDDIKIFKAEIPNGPNLQTMLPPQDLLLNEESDDDYGLNEEADQTQDPVPEFQLQYEQPVLQTSAIVGVADRFNQQEVHPWPHHQS